MEEDDYIDLYFEQFSRTDLLIMIKSYRRLIKEAIDYNMTFDLYDRMKAEIGYEPK